MKQYECDRCADWHVPGPCPRDEWRDDPELDVLPVVDDTVDARCVLCGMRCRTLGELCLRCRSGDTTHDCENCGRPVFGGAVCLDCHAHPQTGAWL